MFPDQRKERLRNKRKGEAEEEGKRKADEQGRERLTVWFVPYGFERETALGSSSWSL